MSIYDELEHDHQEAKELFAQIQAASPRAGKAKAKLFEELKAALLAHSKAEEKVFYPVLKRNDETKSMALEAVEEHHLVELLLRELSRIEPTDERWTAKFTVLKENVEHHVEEEESEIFDKAQEILSDEEADEVGEKFAAQRDKLLEKAG